MLPIVYVSRQSSATVEKECLTIVWTIQTFQMYIYLYGQGFILETSHGSLVYLYKSKVTNLSSMRLALSLQPYMFRIIAINVKNNAGADYYRPIGKLNTKISLFPFIYLSIFSMINS